ncbi:PQQ-binding-like beta-propeller repeat protein [Paenibacillus lycopersici]|uniref:PQQ-binding-like beta-propeller repeat protein n=1 Tax=Paenibacillus lycopersici TaxID=2704462 RepID=A0A6C0G5V8_9BACL|nr:PQQ-binding-like beta-propeller repeat protein [Paenibacillus lycopersici]QHT63094.1 PQQ-binding-like beta-propeller repeat protein [Paenibacillus lycopersici]
MRKFKPMLFGVLAAGLAAASLGAAGTASAQYGSGPSYSLDTSYSFENKVPAAKPLWSADLDPPSAANRVTYPPVVNGNSLYLIKNGTLVARSVASGKALWSFGTKLQPGSAVVAGSFVYVGGADGSVYKVNPSTGAGARIYQTQAKNIYWLKADGSTLYAASSGGLASINLTTGKANWTAGGDAAGHGEPIVLANMLLISTWESGAITVNTYYAVDKATGKTLWRLSGSHNKLLQADGDKLYFNNDWPRNDTSEYVAYVDIVSAKTGQVTKSLSFVKVSTALDPLYQSPKEVTMDGNDIYIVTQENGVFSYNVNDAPDAPARYVSGDYVAGPYNGKIFFRSANNLGLYARKLFDQSAVYYEGLDNPASRVDFIGSGMYVGQTDGAVVALNVTTGKAAFRFQTGARSYGPFQAAGSTLLVQAEGKLYAFRLPAELTKPLDQGPSGAFMKAEASLIIDGKPKQFQPGMMTLNNRMFVPMRFLMQEIGAKVSYDAASRQTTIAYGKASFALAENSASAVKDGQPIPLSYAPTVIGGSLYVPVGDIGKLLGIKVTWEPGPRTVVVTTTAS